MEYDPPLYATAIDYVFYDEKWSWNMRNQTTLSWYQLFGNIVLDTCPILEWGGQDRKNTNYNHFVLNDSVIEEMIDIYPCTVRS